MVCLVMLGLVVVCLFIFLKSGLIMLVFMRVSNFIMVMLFICLKMVSVVLGERLL